MNRRHHQGVENEPHLQKSEFALDPSESRAETVASFDQFDSEERMEHGVWDEPAVSSVLAGNPPKDALTFQRWLTGNIAKQTLAGSWLWCFAIALASGPLAILGALLSQYSSGWGGLILITVIAPLTEEIMKIAIIYWTAERRPFRFTSGTQLIVCAIMSAAVFASVENFLYLWTDVFRLDKPLTAWRWTACMALHVGCSSVAAIGVMRMWRQCIRTRSRPVLATAAPWIIAAVLIHGLYNGAVTIYEMLLAQ